jgi:hypothetical protein
MESDAGPSKEKKTRGSQLEWARDSYRLQRLGADWLERGGGVYRRGGRVRRGLRQETKCREAEAGSKKQQSS